MVALFAVAFLAVDAGLVADRERASLGLLAASLVGAIAYSGWGRTRDVVAAALLGPALAYGASMLVDTWIVRPLALSPRGAAAAIAALSIAGLVSSARARRRA